MKNLKPLNFLEIKLDEWYMTTDSTVIKTSKKNINRWNNAGESIDGNKDMNLILELETPKFESKTPGRPKRVTGFLKISRDKEYWFSEWKDLIRSQPDDLYNGVATLIIGEER